MKKTLPVALSILLVLASTFAQGHPQKPSEDEGIRISTEL